MPAKRVVILDLSTTTDGQGVALNWVLWADVPAVVQPFYADPNKTSAYAGATADELAALRSGAVAELVGVTVFPLEATKAAMAADGEREWQAFQDRVNADPRFAYFGTFWDGSTWIGPDGQPIVTDPLSTSTILDPAMLPRRAPPQTVAESVAAHVPFRYEQPVEAE